MLNLGHILEAIADYRPTGNEPPLTGVVTDSREVEPGCLFVALSGERVDGHEYVGEAFVKGATAALVKRPVSSAHEMIDLRGSATAPAKAWSESPSQPFLILVDDPLESLQEAAAAWYTRFPVRVIAITGSVGKTSTKELAHAVLSKRFRTFKTPGNRNSLVGLPASLFGLRPYHQRAVLEMGMYTTGEIARLCQIAPPQVGVVTIIGPVHLERAGRIENIVAAKQELVEALPDDGVAILNRDDDRVMGMADHTRARVFTYGLNETADLWAGDIGSMGLDGVRFTLHHGGESMRIQVPLLGRHSVHTALRASAVGLIEGLHWDEIISGLHLLGYQLRLVAVPGPRNSVIIDDTYNSSPDSALAALNLLADLPGRRIAVLGDMLELGHVEEEAHRLVGRRAVEVADILLAVGKRGRLIGEEARATGMAPERIHVIEDVMAAAPILEAIIQDQDMVLIKGSYGMRMDRLVAALGQDE